jgi:hypothetical protein
MTSYDYVEHRHYVTQVTVRGEMVWDASCFCGYQGGQFGTKAEATRVLSAHALDGQFSLTQ